MDCCFDRTGFPYIELKDPTLAVSLLPLTKLQFEYYLADLTPQGDNWYEELLTLNPRVSPQRFTPEQRERLFLTGLLPAEAEAYAAWLGDGYRLPTVAEWRAIYRCFQSIKLNCHSGKDAGIQSQGCEALGSSGSSAVTHSLPSLDAGFRLPCRNDGVLSQNENSWPTPCAAALLNRLEEQVRPQTLLDFSLMRGGLVEWVRDSNTWTGLGKPRSSFQRNLWDPLRETVPPVRLNQRVACFGARLVCKRVKIS